jgi:ADP-dependent NAD(P)H-hydrate dehydratase
MQVTPMPSRTEVTPALLRDWQLSKQARGKDDRGTVLVIGGAGKTPGAAILAGLAALRAGAGRLVLALDETAAVAAAIAVPESAVVGLPAGPGQSRRTADTLAPELALADVVVVGPGLDDARQTTELLRCVGTLIGPGTRLVLDAYALGVLRGLAGVYEPWAGRLVLTPNPAEAARLLDSDALAMPEAVPAIAERYRAVVTGQGTIASPDGQIWTVAAGNPGLGTSGSGDVLAGAVGGFLARGATDIQAACWGTYVHAAAGDRLAAALGPMSFLARELLEAMPRVLSELTF